MDIVAFVQSLTATDLVLGLLLASAFVFGAYEGATRGLLALVGWVFSFIIAANVRAPLGEWLSGYWTQYDLAYNQMLAFGVTFAVAVVVAGILLAAFTKRQPLIGRMPLADEILGGLLALIVAVLVLGTIVAGINSGYGQGPELGRVDVPWLTSLREVLSESAIARWASEAVVPLILLVMGPFSPDEFEQLVRR